MSVRLWPKDFERKEHITKAEKALLRNASLNFRHGHIAVGIDPLGLSTDKVKLALYISPTEGVITISLFSDSFQEDLADLYVSLVSTIESQIYGRLLDSKLLIVRNGDSKSLKFPYKHIIMFSSEKAIIVSDDIQQKLNGYVTANSFLPLNFSSDKHRISDLAIFENIRLPFDENFKEISEIESRAIFERLAPEYTVVLHEKEGVEIKDAEYIPESALKITGSESEYKTFLLDEYQVGLVNEMGTGHRVILANPGAGKSVLLLSKAFKYASLYKDSKVLLTCYNNNLADSYKFKRSCANFGDNNNLYIMTFHKLVESLYRDFLKKKLSGHFATEEEIKDCIEYIKAGNIDLKFTAIFIDEVQIFEPYYLELCYLLLDSTPNHIFLMAGDLNQTVRTQSRRGDAPWKKMDSVSLDFKGRVRYIEKNYRNSKLIGEYLNHMLHHMNSRMDMLNMISPREFEYNSFEVGDKQGIAKVIKTGIDRGDIKKEISSAIHEIVTKYGIKYSEIAILFPYQKQIMMKYYPLSWIKQALEDEDIPYSQIFSASNGKTRYSDTNGIVLSTIDSSLGLDFKAVILTGLYPYNYIIRDAKSKMKILSWSQISKMSDSDKELVQMQMRKMYTACSRARELLYVLSDLDPKSPMEELLLERR